jgi:hypothetical protein
MSEPRGAGERSPYLVSAVYDWCFFLLPPLLALGLGIWVSGSWFSQQLFLVGGQVTTLAKVCLGSLIHAHLVAVLFRSHNNPKIFALYPYRFLLVPVLLWVALVGSPWIAISATVVATFWDVWHSGAQTFGFARIYERSVGTQSELGRRLDYWLNQLLYAGPILAGVTLLDHLSAFDGYQTLGAVFFTEIPAAVLGYQRWLAFGVLGFGALFLLFYLYVQWRLWRGGARVSGLKIFLLTTTGFCSIYSWGFNRWGEAFLIMNLFHAVQYLALVWAMERKNIAARLRLTGRRGASLVAGLFFFGAVFGYGIFAEMISSDMTTLWSATMVISLMHFWYDGFIWSVSRQQV